MNKLRSYRRAHINNISIKYGEDQFDFSLWDALRINESILDDELKRQPSYYGFLLLLNKKLNTRFEELKRRRKRLYGLLLIKAKDKRVGNRFMNDDTAKAWVESRKSFNRITRECIKAKDDADTIYAAVQGFQQRKDLLQTLSSNRRKEA